jgi:hypothetical protein
MLPPDPYLLRQDLRELPLSTRLRRWNLFTGMFILAVGVITGAWWAITAGVLSVALALIWPSRATLRAMRAGEKVRALGEGDDSEGVEEGQ